MSEPTDRSAVSASPGRQGDLSNRLIATLLLATFAFSIAYLALLSMLPDPWVTSGSRELYLCGLFGTACALVPFAFSATKRAGLQGRPPTWFSVHVVASLIAVAALTVHSGGEWWTPPALLLALLWLIVLQGAWMRVFLTRRFAQIFSSKLTAFRAGAKPDRNALRAVIAEKQGLLASLDTNAKEATFSPSLRHWLRDPVRTARYLRLVALERKIMGTAASVPWAVGWMRALHMAAAAAFLAGIIVHVVLVTFFASWLNEGQPVDWWHVSDGHVPYGEDGVA